MMRLLQPEILYASAWGIPYVACSSHNLAHRVNTQTEHICHENGDMLALTKDSARRVGH